MLGVVVPAFNEESNIHHVINNAISAKVSKENIFVINNGSKDKTKEIALDCGVNVIDHNNSGYHHAVNRGLSELKKRGYEQFLIIDGDNEIDGSSVRNIINLKNKYDFIFGKRNSPKRLAERILNSFFFKKYGVMDILCGLKYGNLKLVNTEAKYDYAIDCLNLDKLNRYKIYNMDTKINLRSGSRLGSNLYVSYNLMKTLITYLIEKK
jgi:glycosyltransferase involved in cell wall biosynthesis